MAPASWAQKFEKRLSALADGASKESIQTVAKWIGFNRKHGTAFVTTLATVMSSPSNSMARLWLYWQVIHELLLQEKNTSKWDRLEELRVSIGETVVVPLMEKITNATLIDKLKPLVQEWDEVNVFGGPTMINQVKRTFSQQAKVTAESSGNNQSEQPTAPEKSPTITVETKTSNPNTKESTKVSSESTEKTTTLAEKKIPQPEESKEQPKPMMTTLRRQSTIEEISFDFEGQGIPAGKVESREFLEPCKAVATLQIARDLRSDATLQLPSVLSTIPDNIKAICDEYNKKQEETGTDPEIPDDVVMTMSTGLGDAVLDLDLEEVLENLNTFREIVMKMCTARKRLASLLIQSRCQFGSMEAAAAFHGLDETVSALQKRKELLSDAMDLEGLDFEEEPSQSQTDTEQDKQLGPFTWYKQSEEPEPKRQKVE